MDQFKHIFDEHYAGLVDFAMWYTQDSAAAEDIVQTVFINVWEKKDDLLQKPNLKYYLFRAVKNRCLNYLRDTAKLATEELNDFQTSDSEPSAIEQINQKELSQNIDRWINELPPACRRVFVLSRKEEMSHKEIAELLDISTKTIENQITKALKYLRMKINEHGRRG